MNPLNSPFHAHWLPTYAARESNVELNKETLAKGNVQKSALFYFQWVASHCHRDHIKDAFLHMEDMVPGCKFISDTRTPDHLFITTLALALMEDIGPLTHYIINDRSTHERVIVPLSRIAGLIADYAPGCSIDLMHLLTRKDDLIPLPVFCKIYSVKPQDLAVKAIVDDNLDAFKRIHDVNPQAADEALASVVFDSKSAIRDYLRENQGRMSKDEFSARLGYQFSLLCPQDYMPLIDPEKPCSLRVKTGLDVSYSDQTDHQIGLIPGYLELIKEGHVQHFTKFAVYVRRSDGLQPDQSRLIRQTIEDFHKAGLPPADILVIGILNYEGFNKEDYHSLSAEEKERLLAPLLVLKALECGDDQKSWQARKKLEQINHLLRLQPLDAIEAECTEPAHWHVLYRATANQKYLPMLKDRVDRAFSQDLGL